jgi:dipeptidyl aminopeptidase/acylaminoacyl peptidase
MVRFLAAVLAAVLVLPCAADEPDSTWKPDDVLLSETVGGFRLSPDCRHAVWVRGVHDKKKGERVNHLVRTRLSDGEEVRLTRGKDDCRAPRWSPDGKWIAFLSGRPKPDEEPAEAAKRRHRRAEEDEEKDVDQIWLINPFGGEPWPLTEGKRGVRAFEWADRDSLLFSAQEERSLYEIEKKKRKDTSNVVEDERHEPPVRLFRVDIEDKKITRVTDNEDRITAFFPSPDGRQAVTIHERSLRYTYDNRVKPAVFLYDLEKRDRLQLFTETKYNIHQVVWARDGKSFYAANQSTSHPQYVMATVMELLHHDVASRRTVKVDLDWERGLAAEFSDGNFLPGLHTTEDGFLALLADGARNRAARYRLAGDGWKREWLAGDYLFRLGNYRVGESTAHVRNLYGLALGDDGKTLLYATSSASRPSQWYRCRLEANRMTRARRVTESNKHLKGKTFAKSEVIQWKGARDEEVEGILYYPHGYEKGKRYPLVVMIHGGPMGVDMDAWDESWAYPPNLFCQRGAFVLRPNYHGSSNYGLKWVESIAGGKYYDLEVPDIEKGVNALVAKGLVDAEKLGVLGWSNGAILTTALTVTTTRYRAAAAGAGDVDWVSDWGNCEFGAAFDNYYLGKSPLEDPKLYFDKSPFYRLDRVRTPTLIFFGTEDRAVPTQQGWMHYRALQQLGKTDVRFVLFPGEEHSPKKLAHQRRKLEEELAWFDKHLFRTAKEPDESLKKDSPLDRLLRLKDAKRDGARYGVVEKGKLIPETVEHENLRVGRFEVTRAQFREFDSKYAVEPGRENYPAAGVTYERAKAYCRWLSEHAGRKYRLPDAAEAEKLYSSDGEDENTLDAWAGYAVNPEDAARLRKRLSSLPGAAPLLKEVGGGKGTKVFDLGGNVAEWIMTKDDKGEVRGGSADTAADEKTNSRRPGPEYVGFRVVVTD